MAATWSSDRGWHDGAPMRLALVHGRIKWLPACAFVSDGTPGAGDHHSPDVTAVYHGKLEPVYVCGYHASRPDCMARVFASVTR